jgi:hypothetical protein
MKSIPQERPILFKAEMVNAIRGRLKSQTRRPIKPQPFDATPIQPRSIQLLWDGQENTDKFARGTIHQLSPYGKPGDRLWVRETWRPQDGITLHRQNRDEIEYRADGDRPKEPTDCYWKPSIFMPRWASRLTLEITDLRVERLQDISETDAKAEGVSLSEIVRGHKVYHASYRAAFCSLWMSIHGSDSWNANPWVWAITFKRLRK